MKKVFAVFGFMWRFKAKKAVAIKVPVPGPSGYEDGLTQDVIETELFCPKCGGRSVWEEFISSYDTSLICIDCEATFNIAFIVDADQFDKVKINSIKNRK